MPGHHMVYSTHRGHRRASEPLEMGLKASVSCHVGAGDRGWVPWKSSQCPELLRHYPQPAK